MSDNPSSNNIRPAAASGKPQEKPKESDDAVERVGSHPLGAAAGAVGGAVAGAVGGIAAGPVGSLAGAVAGAVAGGVLGSNPGTSTSRGPVTGPAVEEGTDTDQDDKPSSRTDTAEREAGDRSRPGKPR